MLCRVRSFERFYAPESLRRKFRPPLKGAGAPREPLVFTPSKNEETPEGSGVSVLARMTGLEPATSGVTGRCSNQLSYIPRSMLSSRQDKDTPSRTRKSRLCAMGLRRRTLAFLDRSLAVKGSQSHLLIFVAPKNSARADLRAGQEGGHHGGRLAARGNIPPPTTVQKAMLPLIDRDGLTKPVIADHRRGGSGQRDRGDLRRCRRPGRRRDPTAATFATTPRTLRIRLTRGVGWAEEQAKTHR